jgi:hypothetical protein
MTLQIEVREPIGAGDQGEQLSIVPVPVRGEMWGYPCNSCYNPRFYEPVNSRT